MCPPARVKDGFKLWKSPKQKKFQLKALCRKSIKLLKKKQQQESERNINLPAK